MPIVEIAETLIDLIKRNIIAKTNVIADVTTGDVNVPVEDSFRFNDDEEIVLIDYGYNDPSSSHYKQFEYAQIKSVNNTHSITLKTPIISTWTTANHSFIQKTIGHSPLYEENIYYGDREVIPSEDMAIAVEPVSLSNDWIYIRGGLSEEFRLKVMIYGKTIKTTEGRKILDEYSDAVYSLLMHHLHMPVKSYQAPLLSDVSNGDSVVIVADTAENRENIILSSLMADPHKYTFQDNLGASCHYYEVTNISTGGGLMRVTITPPAVGQFTLDEYGILRKVGTYIYDSRVDSITYGVVSKGSAFLRASELSWWGKRVNEFTFPQIMKGGRDFTQKYPDESSSSSSG